MSNVFLGGSRNLTRLDDGIKGRLENLIAEGHKIIIGDANGMDKALQSFFAKHNYFNVIVYCMHGECRNNVGNWPIKSINAPTKTKDFSYFATKDMALSLDADFGFMIWDGISKGTLNNLINLINQSKSSLVYHADKKEFIKLKTTDDLIHLIANQPIEVIDYFNKKIKLEARLNFSKQFSLNF